MVGQSLRIGITIPLSAMFDFVLITEVVWVGQFPGEKPYKLINLSMHS